MDTIFKSWKAQYEIFNGDKHKRKKYKKTMQYITASCLFEKHLNEVKVDIKNSCKIKHKTRTLLNNEEIDHDRLQMDYKNNKYRGKFKTYETLWEHILECDEYTTHIDYNIMNQVYYDQKDRFPDEVSLKMSCYYDITDKKLNNIRESGYHDIVTMKEYCLTHTPPKCSIYLKLNDVSPMKPKVFTYRPSGSVNFCPLEM
jgi:hypothetical protein